MKPNDFMTEILSAVPPTILAAGIARGCQQLCAQQPAALHAFSEEARMPTHMFMGRNKGVPLTELESSEIEWYLDRHFIDQYQRKSLERELERRRRSQRSWNEDLKENDAA